VIQLLSKKATSAALLSAVLFMSYWFLVGESTLSYFFKFTLLIGEGFLLNYFCYRHSILGKPTNLPLVMFTVLAVLIMPELSYADLIYGAVWLGAFFLAFESREHPEKSTSYVIYVGVLLGIAQSVSSISVFLLIPIFILFIQTGIHSSRSFLLAGLYFIMVQIAYIGIVYVMELEHRIGMLVPAVAFDYSVFNTILNKLVVPFVIVSLIIHFLSLNSYKFRYPNKSIILNFTILIQLVSAVILMMLTAEVNLYIYVIMASALLLSFGFLYASGRIFVNAAFASLMCIAVMSLYLYKILIL
jgi:hypothetical protein